MNTDVRSLPLVSVLIPTHNRPHFLKIALESVLAQTYRNIEIIVSDNSDDEVSMEMMLAYLNVHTNIHYSRVPGYSARDNSRNCMDLAKGDFINYLMDDDVFNPNKISRMMEAILLNEQIGLVTSFRQLIDENGTQIPPLPGTDRLFEGDTHIEGPSFARMILNNGKNLIGEPTTVLFRKTAINQYFGWFGQEEYVTLSDVATWLNIMSKFNCVYLPEALSYFRIHGGQDQKRESIGLLSNIEWLRLLCNSLEHGYFFSDAKVGKDLLNIKLISSINYLHDNENPILTDESLRKNVNDTLRRATSLLF
jgi:glycosyltransferase involved in cell wall biosynthesis